MIIICKSSHFILKKRTNWNKKKDKKIEDKKSIDYPLFRNITLFVYTKIKSQEILRHHPLREPNTIVGEKDVDGGLFIRGEVDVKSSTW